MAQKYFSANILNYSTDVVDQPFSPEQDQRVATDPIIQNPLYYCTTGKSLSWWDLRW